jgi:hypothetical protein
MIGDGNGVRGGILLTIISNEMVGNEKVGNFCGRGMESPGIPPWESGRTPGRGV